MTVASTGHHFPTRFIGLSTDTKPENAMIAATFYETDTRHEYLWDGADWKRSATEAVEQIAAVEVKDTAITNDLLNEILTQLKIQNAYLSLVTDEALEDTEVA